MRQEQGNNLCGYYVCEFIHGFVGPKMMTEKEFDVRKLPTILLNFYYATLFIKTNEDFSWQVMVMSEDLIEPERVKAVQEQLMGFLLDEVVNPNGEFYTDHRISIGLMDPDRGKDEEEEEFQKKKKKKD